MFYGHEIAAVDLLKIYFMKNAKKTCKPNNRDLNRDWIKSISHEFWRAFIEANKTNFFWRWGSDLANDLRYRYLLKYFTTL